MIRNTTRGRTAFQRMLIPALLVGWGMGCDSSSSSTNGSGGKSTSDGSALGGQSPGGSSSNGGSGAGGSIAKGGNTGASSGGSLSGGSSTKGGSGGADGGVVVTGGSITGGTNNGGTNSGGTNPGTGGAPTGGAGGNTPGSVERWGIYEATFTGPSSGNPYVDVQFSATFTQAGKSVKVPGFWDSGSTYKVRFSPPTAGAWEYQTTSTTAELNGKTGSFIAAEASGDNHGPVEVVDTYYFRYADGSRYHMLGTTSYQWTSMTEEIQQQTLKSLAGAAFTKYRYAIFPKWYAHNNIEPDRAAFQKAGDKYDFTKPDPVFWARFEQRLLDLQKMGIEADVILWHPYDKWDDKPLPIWRFNRMGAEADDRYLRYCIARLSAFRNLWWSLANEWEWSAHDVAAFERFGKILQEEDPHQRLRSIHNGSKVYDQTKPWITHVSLQKHDTGNGLGYRTQWKKPVVFDEYGYEGNIPEGYGRASGQEIMKKTYAANFSGAYPTHGECFTDPNEVIWWGKGGLLKGESWKRFKFLREMMAAAPPFNEMTAGSSMLVKDGAYYLVYCPSAGSKTVQLSGTKSYKVDRLDTWEMTVTPVGTAPPGAYSFSAPKGDVVYRFAPE